MRATAEILLWWLVLTGLWLLTLATPSAPEVITGAAFAALCAVAAGSARRAMRGSWRLRPSWLTWWATVPWAAVRDSVAALVTVFARPSAGRFDEVTVPAESGPEHEARLAVATVVGGCTPGTMIVASPPDGDRIVVHRLLRTPSATLDRVTR
jgi:multisubunit Na+/H+ antiporter MnhE subunit